MDYYGKAVLRVYSSHCKGGEGNWTQDGCTLAGEEDGVVSCECNHLTNFGVLVVSMSYTCTEY